MFRNLIRLTVILLSGCSAQTANQWLHIWGSPSQLWTSGEALLSLTLQADVNLLVMMWRKVCFSLLKSTLKTCGGTFRFPLILGSCHPLCGAFLWSLRDNRPSRNMIVEKQNPSSTRRLSPNPFRWHCVRVRGGGVASRLAWRLR